MDIRSNDGERKPINEQNKSAGRIQAIYNHMQ